MISITRAQVPAYLVDSAFYASLSVEDSEEFSVPAENLKLTQQVDDVEQLVQLLHTLRFWGVNKFDDSGLISYLGSVPVEERELVGQLLRDFEWSSELAMWFTSFHALNDASPTDPEYPQLISGSNALASISPFLVSPNETLRAKSLAVLTTVASASNETAEQVHSAASTHIVKLGNIIDDSTPTAFARNVARLLSHVFKYFDEEEAVVTVVLLLTRLLSWTDFATIASACLAVYTFMENGDEEPERRIERISLVIGVVPRLMELICCEVVFVQAAALRAVSAVCSGSDEQTQAVVDSGVVPILASLLEALPGHTLRDVLCVIVNLAAGTHEQVQALVDAGVFSALFESTLSPDFEYNDMYSEVISAAISAASREQLVYLVESGIVRVICKFLRQLLDSEDDALEAIESIEYLLSFFCGDKQHNPTMYDTVRKQITECGGVESIKIIAENEDDDVGKLAQSLIKRYFAAKKRARK